MNCIEFEADLASQRDARIPLSPDALAHMADCPHCCQEWRQNQQLNAAILAWRPVSDVPDLVDRVLQQLATSPHGISDSETDIAIPEDLPAVRLASTHSVSPGRGRGQVALFASITACIIVAVIGLVQQRQHDSRPLAENRNPPPVNSSTDGTTLDVSTTLAEVFSDLGSEYREIAQETQSVARDLARVLPQVNDVTVRHDVEPETDPQPVSTDPAKIWRPISSRVETALGFLWQAIPQELPSG